MLRRAANFPDPLVGLPPDFLQMFEKGELRRPARRVGRQSAPPRLVMDVHDLAEDVELKLAVSGVAEAHRRRIFVTRQPRRDPFGQPPLTGDAVHDLQLARTAGYRAQQPFAPCLRLVEVTGTHGAEQNQRGVAQPAIAVVPVALAADFFRQRCGGSGDHAAGRRVGQRLERQHGAQYGVRPLAGGPAFCRPVPPKCLGVVKRRDWIEAGLQRPMRREIAQDKRNGLAGGDGEFADRGHLLAAQMHRRAQGQHIRAGNGAKRSVFEPGHPGYDGAVPEAQNELRAHGQPAARTYDQTDDSRMTPRERHEIDQRGGAVVGFEQRLQYKGIRPIAACDRAPAPEARSASGHVQVHRAAPQNTPPNRNAGSTASRSIPRGRPAPPSCNRR